MTLTFKDLLASPPALKKTTKTLPDGREYELYQLPMSALDKVVSQGRAAVGKNTDIAFSEISEVAAQGLLGRKPEPEEVAQMMDVFCPDLVIEIYREALSFSHLGSGAVSKAKKG